MEEDDSTKMAGFESCRIRKLPNELLDEIFEYLDNSTAISVRVVSPQFAEVGRRFVYRVLHMSLTHRGIRKLVIASNDAEISAWVKRIIIEDVLPKNLRADAWPVTLKRVNQKLFEKALVSFGTRSRRMDWASQINTVVAAVGRLHGAKDVEYCHGFKRPLRKSQNILEVPFRVGRATRKKYLSALQEHKVNEAVYEATILGRIQRHRYSRFELFHAIQRTISHRSTIKRITIKPGYYMLRNLHDQSYIDHLKSNVQHLDVVYNFKAQLIPLTGYSSMLGIGFHELTNLTTLSLIGKAPGISNRLNLAWAASGGLVITMPHLLHLKKAHFENCSFNSDMLGWLHGHPASFTLKDNVYPRHTSGFYSRTFTSAVLSIQILGFYAEKWSPVSGVEPFREIIWLVGTDEQAVQKARSLRDCGWPNPFPWNRPTYYVPAGYMNEYFMTGKHAPHSLLNAWHEGSST